MTTKTEYRHYLASEVWLRRRKVFLQEHDACNQCGISREEAIELYDQDSNMIANGGVLHT